jgi:hypothetical protein
MTKRPAVETLLIRNRQRNHFVPGTSRFVSRAIQQSGVCQSRCLRRAFNDVCVRLGYCVRFTPMLLDPSLRLPVRCLSARAGPAKEARTLRWLISRNFLGLCLWTICEPRAPSHEQAFSRHRFWGLAYQMLCRSISLRGSYRCQRHDSTAFQGRSMSFPHQLGPLVPATCGRLFEPAILTASRPGGTHLP